MVYDPIRQRVILFGGTDCNESPCADANDTWSWDGSLWTRLDTPLAPPPRRAPAMAWDDARQVIVLFGGWSNAATLGDTWIWDGNLWTEQHPVPSPLPRGGAGMTFDGARGQILMFGGEGNSDSDTWTWDGVSWTELRPRHVPDPRYHMGLAFDPLHQNVVLFGGAWADQEGEYTRDDTWTWDGSDWTLRHPAQEGPYSEADPMFFDPVGGRIALFVGTTWFWDGSTWRLGDQSPPAEFTIGMRMVFDEARGNALLFGAGFTRCDGAGDTWTWDEGPWELKNPPPCPDSRDSFGMAYDSAHKDIVLFSGVRSCYYCSGELRDTWLWTGARWRYQRQAASPFSRYNEAMAYDAARRQVVMFGGEGCSPHRCEYYLAHTAVWDGAHWSRPPVSYEPPPRTEPSMAYDGARKVILLFGGESEGGLTSQTWTWDGATWTLLQPPASPPPMRGAPMAYDAARGQVVLFGTDGSTWTWDGVSWARQSPAPSPSADEATMAYDAATKQVILFGGTSQDQTWAWDGSAWTQFLPATSPSPRTGERLVYEAARHEVYLFGGRATVGGDPLGDTWTWDSGTWTQVGPPIGTASTSGQGRRRSDNGAAALRV